MILAVLIHIQNQNALLVEEVVISRFIIVGMFIIGALTMYYDYRYNVLPSLIHNDSKSCPYCDGELWTDEDGSFFCPGCQRHL